MDKEKRRPQPAAQGAIVLGMAGSDAAFAVFARLSASQSRQAEGELFTRLHREFAEEPAASPDEAPGCCKRLPKVLAAHGETIRVVHTLRPVGVGMAGRDTFDPYRD